MTCRSGHRDFKECRSSRCWSSPATRSEGAAARHARVGQATLDVPSLPRGPSGSEREGRDSLRKGTLIAKAGFAGRRRPRGAGPRRKSPTRGPRRNRDAVEEADPQTLYQTPRASTGAHPAGSAGGRRRGSVPQSARRAWVRRLARDLGLFSRQGAGPKGDPAGDVHALREVDHDRAPSAPPRWPAGMSWPLARWIREVRARWRTSRSPHQKIAGPGLHRNWTDSHVTIAGCGYTDLESFSRCAHKEQDVKVTLLAFL